MNATDGKPVSFNFLITNYPKYYLFSVIHTFILLKMDWNEILSHCHHYTPRKYREAYI